MPRVVLIYYAALFLVEVARGLERGIYRVVIEDDLIAPPRVMFFATVSRYF